MIRKELYWVDALIHTIIIDGEIVTYQLVDLKNLSLESLIKDDGTYIVNSKRFKNWEYGMKKRMIA